MDHIFDVIIVGGGHAGVEAAAAAARLGVKTALVTQKISRIGELSCNPAFGGLGKGHLIREIDALDGVMGRAADRAAIQYRLLNRRKGPAVQGPRVQADRALYKIAVREILSEHKDLVLIEAECRELLLQNRSVVGILTADNRALYAASVVITAGTFLNGVIHRGEDRVPAGRVGDPPSLHLSTQLSQLGLRVGRLKTGTPPRLDGRTIDFSALEQQWGDPDPQFLSSLTRSVNAPQSLCFITRTNSSSHRIVQNNIQRTAIYSGAISGKGPRYCPSIEDKVVRFSDRDSHQIFLEPEGLNANTIYPNGISTSLPNEVQREFVRTIPGLKDVRITQYGYAIEYDYFCPTQLDSRLMSRSIEGLFFAGQVNGTTGYEEAGAQGVVAGINAALRANEKEGFTLSRDVSYIGVMVDDLISKGVTEPYRMFTSRAEYRLSLRADNADERLTPLAIKMGLATQSRIDHFAAQSRALSCGRALMRKTMVTAAELRGVNVPVVGGDRKSVFDWCTSSEVDLANLVQHFPALSTFPKALQSRLDADAKYSVYVGRQERDMQRQREAESLRIPSGLDFDEIGGLSRELKLRLRDSRPSTIGEASRLEGMTPAALMLLAVHARRFAASSVTRASAAVSHETV